MKQDVVTTRIQLPADFADRLVAGIAKSRASTLLPSGGKPILRLQKGKGGVWVFGQNDEEVQEGSRWLLNIATMAHGYVCWAGGSIRGETMTSVFNDKPPKPDPVTTEPIKGQTTWPFKEQRAFDLKCIDGDDAGTEVLYKISSDGGIKEVDRLMVALTARATETKVYLFPVVRLEKSGYEHKEYSWTNTPVFQIVGWTDVNGNTEDAAVNNVDMDDMPDPSTNRGPGRPRKAPIAPPTEEPPLTTQQAHATGQPVRRRPGR